MDGDLTVQVLVSLATTRLAISVPVAFALTAAEVVYWNVLLLTFEMAALVTLYGAPVVVSPEILTVVPLAQPLGSEPVSVTLPVVVVPPVGVPMVV